MKFDIARAWKDETYRQTLSEEQMNTLPANPAGELSETDLEAISGGWAGGWAGGPCPTTGVYEHNESYGLICEVNVFSLSVLGNIALLGSAVQNCVKG